MLKHAQPESLKSRTDPSQADEFRQVSPINPDNDHRQGLKPHAAANSAGPLTFAFITTNPLLPREYFVNRGVDKLVLTMNEGVAHSLLNCKGKYSVQVATFSGHVIIDQQKIRRIEHGSMEDAGKSGLEERPKRRMP